MFEGVDVLTDNTIFQYVTKVRAGIDATKGFRFHKRG